MNILVRHKTMDYGLTFCKNALTDEGVVASLFQVFDIPLFTQPLILIATTHQKIFENAIPGQHLG